MPKLTKKQRWKKYAEGGEVDNIPALLTEGEYVIKKSSAEAIGYDNLNKLNASGMLPTQDARDRRRKK